MSFWVDLGLPWVNPSCTCLPCLVKLSGERWFRNQGRRGHAVYSPGWGRHVADGLSTPTLPWSLVMAELLGAVALHSMLANIQTAPHPPHPVGLVCREPAGSSCWETQLLTPGDPHSSLAVPPMPHLQMWPLRGVSPGVRPEGSRSE